jgi:hypothetical protein
MSLPPLAAVVQTTILSHLLPPNIPLPQELLAKSLLQRHLYLPPPLDDIDAWLNPVPAPGIAQLLENLAGIGWRVLDVGYGHDGEVYLARVKVVEEGRGEGEGQEVDVVFELDGGIPAVAEGGSGQSEENGSGAKEGRGWVYHSIYDGRQGHSMSSITWVNNPSQVQVQLQAEDQSDQPSFSDHDNHTTNLNDDPTSAPQGYWAGFSPPTSPRMDENGNHIPQGEDDYWASYGKSFTPGGVTPAVQRSPAASRRPTQDLISPKKGSSAGNDNKVATGLGLGANEAVEKGQSTNALSGGDGILRSRIEMKIASTLRKLWVAYLPSSDPELRALTFLSLGRAVQDPNSNLVPTGVGEDKEGTKGKMEMLYEVYQVIEEGGGDGEGFNRLVEKSLTAPGSMDGFGVGNRQDSSAQLNYWE